MYNGKNDSIRTCCLINMLRSMNNSMIGIWYVYTEDEKGSPADNMPSADSVLWEFKTDGSLMITDKDSQVSCVNYAVNDGEIIVMRDKLSEIFTAEYTDKDELRLIKLGSPAKKVCLRRKLKRG